MKYEELGRSGLMVSKLALGTWALGGGSVWTDKDSTVEEAKSLLDACKDHGINYLDTAPVYGTGVSEELLGKALKGRRQDWIIQSKCSLNWRGEGGNFHYERDGYTVNNDTSARAVKKDVEDILKRMDLDYLDSVIVHYVCHSWPEEETAGALEELIKEGKIRAYGLSNSQPADLEKYCIGAGAAAKNGGASLVQEFFSILSPFHGRDYFDMCRKYGASFQTYGVLEEGFLTGPDFLNREFKKTDIRSRIPWVEGDKKAGLRKAFEAWKPLCEAHHCSYSNLVQAWALTQYDKMSLLVGMRRPESVADSARCMDIVLTPEEVSMMEQTVKEIQVEVLDK
ncbi:MAG: aldo/keto reductase [Firmicutes bacterium]|nr:aldo/keto reductase [Bacillota bacterium]